MKKLELILGGSAIFGIALKLFSITGGGIITMIAFSFLLMYYYIFSFALFNGIDFKGLFKKQSYNETNGKKIALAIILGFCLSMILTGILFIVQLYPGGSFMLILGLIATGIISIITAIGYFKNKADFHIRIFKRILVYSILGLTFLLLSETTFVEIYYKDYPEYVEKYKEHLDKPDDIQLQEELYDMRNEMYEEESQGE